MKKRLPESNRAKKIIKLHNGVIRALKTSLEDAIEIGKLLVEQKTLTKHGAWLPWIKETLLFSDQTARNYMRLYDRQKEIKFKRVLNLTDAFKLLNPPKIIDVEPVQDERMNGLYMDMLISFPQNKEKVIDPKDIHIPENWDVDESLNEITSRIKEINLYAKDLVDQFCKLNRQADTIKFDNEHKVSKLTSLFNDRNYTEAHSIALWVIQWAFALELMLQCRENPELIVGGKTIFDITSEEIARIQTEPLANFANKLGLDYVDPEYY